MKNIRRKVFISYFFNPLFYIYLGALTGILLPALHIPYLWIAIVVMALAIPAWYVKPWLLYIDGHKEEILMEEDFIP